MSTQTNTAEKSTQKIGARTLALVGMLSAVAVVLMTFDIPLPFAPTFYKIDFSEVPDTLYILAQFYNLVKSISFKFLIPSFLFKRPFVFSPILFHKDMHDH